MCEAFLYQGRVAREPYATLDELAPQHDWVDPLWICSLRRRQRRIGPGEQRHSAVHLPRLRERFPILADRLGLLHARPCFGASRPRALFAQPHLLPEPLAQHASDFAGERIANLKEIRRRLLEGRAPQ